MDSLKRKQIYEQVLKDMAADGQLNESAVNEMEEPPLYLDTDMSTVTEFGEKIFNLAFDIWKDDNEAGEQLLKELKMLQTNVRSMRMFFNQLVVHLEQEIIMNDIEDNVQHQ